jgi:pimeloyl-ACP methyl ester carboxylesterase
MLVTRVRIHYEVEGHGPPLVLLHGGLSNLKIWYELGYVNSLKNDYQLVLIDIRGYGASDKPHNPEAYELKLLVDDIVAVLDDLNVNKAHFLGYSMSGRLGFGVAKYAPERFYSFIIGGAHPYMPDQSELDADIQLFKKGMDAVIAMMEEALGSRMPPERKARLEANDLEAIVALFSAKHWRLSLEDVLPTMTMPCLVFVGEADPLYSGAKECVRNMPNATLISLPGLSHFEVLSKTHLLLPHITKFLARAGQM